MDLLWTPSVGSDVGSPLTELWGCPLTYKGPGWCYDPNISDLELFLPFPHNLGLAQGNGNSSLFPLPLQVSSSPPGISWTLETLPFPPPHPMAQML